ncbi:MAG: SAM-dependent methyltransferase [Limisphaerales bacterium]
MHLFLTEPGDEPFLSDELKQTFVGAETELLAPGLLRSDVALHSAMEPVLAFTRQTLPEAHAVSAASIREWSERLFEAVAQLPEGQPWRLHLAPHYGGEGAGENRMRFIRDALRELLKKRRRHLLRSLEEAEVPFRATTSLVQLLLTAPDAGFLSVALAPQPWQLRRCVWPFQKGEVPIASDKAAPSRAFAKLVEAELRLGQRIAAGETCVDLGACPGSWTYVAVNRGARVTAVDRSPLREDLMANPLVTFHQGDAFKFAPPEPVDWLLCDVIAAPERSIELVLDWARERRCRRFIVTIKFKGQGDYGKLAPLKHALPSLCKEFFLTRLCANKNEACVMGVLPDFTPAQPSS